MPCGAGRSSAPASAEVLEMAEPSKTEQRKAEHVNIFLQENVSAEYNYWNDLRECRVHEPDIVPVVVLRGDVLLEDDVDMFRLALLRFGGLGHLRDLGRLGCRRRAGPGVHPGRGSLRYR